MHKMNKMNNKIMNKLIDDVEERDESVRWVRPERPSDS
jgi:hypothetical protein